MYIQRKNEDIIGWIQRVEGILEALKPICEHEQKDIRGILFVALTLLLQMI